MNSANAWLAQLESWVWGPILVTLLIGTGVYFTLMLRGLQFTGLWRAIRHVRTPIHGKVKGDVSPYQSLTTALAGAIGTGNVAGVATAVAIGGVGSIFWIWISGLVGMAITYAEATLSVRYRRVNERGEMAGGPMYYMESGLNMRWLALIYAFFGVVASLGIGNVVQAHSIAEVMQGTFGISPVWTGLILTWSVAVIILGGIRSIGKVTGVLIPVMFCLYILAGIIVVVANAGMLPYTLSLIVSSAFTGQAAVGGFVGSTAMLAIRFGISRGVFSNEAGLGSNSIAAAAAKTDEPCRQAHIAMLGTFVDTLLICTVTGLVIAITQVLGTTDGEGTLLTSSALTSYAFNLVIPGGNVLVAITLVLFAGSTILAWTYYGEKCLEYLLGGNRGWFAFRLFFILILFSGALLPLETVWTFANIANGCMAFPNLLALLLLSSVVARETKLYLEKVK